MKTIREVSVWLLVLHRSACTRFPSRPSSGSVTNA